MNTNNISQGNGQNVQFLPWLGQFLSSRRRAKNNGDTATSATDYQAQDSVGYHSDGSYAHGKPVGTETQWSIDGCGKVPGPAFGMSRGDIALYMLHARAMALCGVALEQVKSYGLSVFESKYGLERVKFEGRIEAGNRLTDNLSARVETLRKEKDALSPTIITPANKFSLPLDIRLVWLLFIGLLWVGVLGAEWTNAASKLFDLVDSRSLAYLATTIFLGIVVAAEWMIARAVGASARPFVVAWRILSPICFALYVFLFAWRFGPGAGAAEVDGLSNLMDTVSSHNDGRMLDRVVYFLQLASGIVVGASLIEKMKHMIVGRDIVIKNPDRETLEATIADLTDQINHEAAPVKKAEGHLVEWNGSLASFLGHGERAYRSVEAERKLWERERQLLESERKMIEDERHSLTGTLTFGNRH